MLTTLVLAAALSSTPCLSTQPGPTWQCHNGGWLPPGHPDLPTQPTAPPAGPYTPSGTDAQTFLVGHRYVHAATGREVFVTGYVELSAGIPVIVLECLNVADVCHDVGELRASPANVSSSGWYEVGEVR